MRISFVEFIKTEFENDKEEYLAAAYRFYCKREDDREVVNTWFNNPEQKT